MGLVDVTDVLGLKTEAEADVPSRRESGSAGAEESGVSEELTQRCERKGRGKFYHKGHKDHEVHAQKHVNSSIRGSDFFVNFVSFMVNQFLYLTPGAFA